LRQLIRRHSRFLDRERTSALLDGCFESMKGLVPRIRASYSEEMPMDLGNGDNQVAQLMLEDGCFILHRLLKISLTMMRIGLRFMADRATCCCLRTRSLSS
jgi:hypothetical protein